MPAIILFALLPNLINKSLTCRAVSIGCGHETNFDDYFGGGIGWLRVKTKEDN